MERVVINESGELGVYGKNLCLCGSMGPFILVRGKVCLGCFEHDNPVPPFQNQSGFKNDLICNIKSEFNKSKFSITV